jgi:acetoin:2,6-dichlorophenolindophenol oxidoreductase subunit alpha
MAKPTAAGTVAKLAGSKDDARRVLATMWAIRRFEEAVDEMFARGMLYGTMHLSIGQEASATGACLALRDDDVITSTHRGHGHCIAKGADLGRMMAELLARDTGYCRGRGGSMHIADVSKGNLGANGIVAGGIPIAVGAGLALKLQGTDKVALSFFGDGATSEGAFHESVNLAAIWDLPVVFVCENNHYGMSMSVAEVSRLERVAERAAGYGIPGVTVDGNDVQEVYRAASEAVAHARAGRGPTLIEAITYRWKGHSKSDQNLYRTREEIESWRRRDPIDRFEQAVLEARTLDEAEVQKIRDQARGAVRDAVRTGQAGPPPSTDLLAGVYAPSEVDALTVTGDGAPAPPSPEAPSAAGPVAAAAGAREEAEAP